MSYRNAGAFIPTSQVWDVSEIYETEVTSPAFKELLVRLYQNLNNMALAINGKDTGIYHTDEFVTGKLYPPDPTSTSATLTKPIQRPVYRKVIDFGALPNAATKTVAHGLTVSATMIWVNMYGCATDPVALIGIPIPYASDTASDNIELWVDNTNVNITTAADWRAYSKCYIVLEYLKF
jgi:hypothetical protein